MKLYTQRSDNGEFIEVGNATQISKNIDTLFIRINVLLHTNDVEKIRKNIADKTGKNCVVVDEKIELDRTE